MDKNFALFTNSGLSEVSDPPPDVVIILLPLNDKIPMSPNAPHFLPLYFEPSASAASSQ